MADLVLTLANVKPTATTNLVRATAGATVEVGDVVYLDTTQTPNKVLSIDADVLVTSVIYGMAMNRALLDQPIDVATSGNVTLGAILTAGMWYVGSVNGGKIAVIGDLTTGDFPHFLGFAADTSTLTLHIFGGGVALGADIA